MWWLAVSCFLFVCGLVEYVSIEGERVSVVRLHWPSDNLLVVNCNWMDGWPIKFMRKGIKSVGDRKVLGQGVI